MDLEMLARRAAAMDGAGYKRYKELKGEWDAGAFVLAIDHVQGDPFAEPSRVRALVPASTSALPAWAHRTPDRRRAAADFLNRVLWGALNERSRRAGSGKSGELRVLRPGQQVLERASVTVAPDGGVEARFRIGLPARGRRILGKSAGALLARTVPEAVLASLRLSAVDAGAFRRHVEAVEDAVALRAQLAERRLVAFVADGAVLPRRSGVDDRPLEGEGVVPFRAPDRLRVELHAPNAGTLSGLGVPEGVTLIVGGGYHGKSTLLEGIERGVYDHVAGDGRERVVTRQDAVKIRAEDGRSVSGTDISGFIADLPDGADTRRFRTANASGSTSQAAAIAEMLEVGTGCLLLDEDTSATNFLIRDARMQDLIAPEDEPITPFIDRAVQLHRERGVSTVLVVGGSGDYFDVADTVLAMRAYVPADVTAEARAVAARHPTRRAREGGPLRPPAERRLDPASIEVRDRRGRVRIRVRQRDRLELGEERVDLAGLEQVVEAAQTRAMAQALAGPLRAELVAGRGVAEAARAIAARIHADGLAAIDDEAVGEYAWFRPHEIAALLNRLRGLHTDP